MDHNKLWKILKEMGIPDHLTCLLRNLYSGQEETELDMEQQTGSKLGREYSAVKNPPANAVSWVLPSGWEDPLEKGMVAHSSVLA